MAEAVRIEKAPLPAEGQVVRIVADGTPIALFRRSGELYAVDARCTHVGGPLDQGAFHGTRVSCPWHGSVFDVRDGKVVRGPAVRNATSYRVHLEGETLILERS
ncbi:MAG: Rieske (2Fe-2S) protein [Thermoplasmata archaeon]